MSDFKPEVVRRYKDTDDRLSRLESYPLGPSLAEFYGDYRGLPGLRALWYPGVVDQTGAVYDASGQGRTLAYNGGATGPQINLHNSVIPYYALDGAGDFLSRVDEAGLDVIGTETYIAAALRGLTFGGWFWMTSVAAQSTIISKHNPTLNKRAFTIAALSPFTAFQTSVSVNGTALVSVSSGTPALATWYFMVSRFTPSTELAIFMNGVKAINTTSIPASIFNSDSDFRIGTNGDNTQIMTGRWGGVAFLCAATLPDDLLTYLWMRGRTLFGV